MLVRKLHVAPASITGVPVFGVLDRLSILSMCSQEIAGDGSSVRPLLSIWETQVQFLVPWVSQAQPELLWIFED